MWDLSGAGQSESGKDFDKMAVISNYRKIKISCSARKRHCYGSEWLSPV